jgi:hypothetical protein
MFEVTDLRQRRLALRLRAEEDKQWITFYKRANDVRLARVLVQQLSQRPELERARAGRYVHSLATVARHEQRAQSRRRLARVVGLVFTVPAKMLQVLCTAIDELFRTPMRAIQAEPGRQEGNCETRPRCFAQRPPKRLTRSPKEVGLLDLFGQTFSHACATSMTASAPSRSCGVCVIKNSRRYPPRRSTSRFICSHTTEEQTADYVRDKIGELVGPISAVRPAWMAKVLSPKNASRPRLGHCFCRDGAQKHRCASGPNGPTIPILQGVWRRVRCTD